MKRPAPLEVALAAFTALAGLDACSQQPISVPVRSLERSGAVSFVCFDGVRGRTAEGCSANPPSDPTDWTSPHVLALVTQTTRGEVAVVDVSANSVLDADPTTPGFNFLQVGAQPTAIASTPGGTATFVGVAAPRREGLFAIPTSSIAGTPATWQTGGRFRLTAWPACALPSAPGSVVVVVDPARDPADASTSRATCDGAYGSVAPGPAGFDLSAEQGPAGARKLLVTLPALGALAVIDAQDVLARAPGSFDACTVERFVPLAVDVPTAPVVELPAEGEPSNPACVSPPAPVPPAPAAWKAHPAQVALSDDGRLFIADDAVPVVHVLDARRPCDLVERAPLLPVSSTTPERTVVTSAIAVSPLTHDGARFVYASDRFDGSVMAFDVSDGAASRAPLRHAHAADDLVESADRITFSSPARAIAFAQRDVPWIDALGVGHGGLLCDPTPGSTSPGSGYRTSSDFLTGAGPRTLRGVFAFLALESGVLAVIDVDDLDAPCRRPLGAGDAFVGCAPGGASAYASSGEATCSVVEPHRPRSARFVLDDPNVGTHVPSLIVMPRLSSVDGRTLTEVATSPTLASGDAQHPAPLAGGAAAPSDQLSFPLEEPRAHVSQDWVLTYEGKLPGFDGHVAQLQCRTSGDDPLLCPSAAFSLFDVGTQFCAAGVHDAQAGAALGAPGDVVSLVDDFPAQDDPYWASVAGSCTWLACRSSFGPSDLPTAARDLSVSEAYPNQLVLAPHVVSDVTDPAKARALPLRCCFPYQPRYTVRAAGQWLVGGSVTGVLHHVVSDAAASGRCIDSCEPLVAKHVSRAVEGKLFASSVLSFSIASGSAPSERDMVFSFSERGGFEPLMAGLSISSTLVAPQSLTWVPALGQLAVADGAAQGLVLVDPATVSLSRSFY